ncbi:MAG: rubredoxin [Alphaproteobacteria bacterium]
MQKQICTVCDYIYDPAKGDPEAGIPPGTPFEDLSKDWWCPECGAFKDDFEALAEA